MLCVVHAQGVSCVQGSAGWPEAYSLCSIKLRAPSHSIISADKLLPCFNLQVDPESAQLIDSLTYEELVGPNANGFVKKLADAQLGPMLAALGLDEDPFTFFVEVRREGALL